MQDTFHCVVPNGGSDLIIKNHKILPPRLVFFLKCSCLRCIAHRKLKASGVFRLC